MLHKVVLMQLKIIKMMETLFIDYFTILLKEETIELEKLMFTDLLKFLQILSINFI